MTKPLDIIVPRIEEVRMIKAYLKDELKQMDMDDHLRGGINFNNRYIDLTQTLNKYRLEYNYLELMEDDED